MPIETIISLAVSITAVLFTGLSFRRTQNVDTASNATERATMTADIRYIRASIDEIKLENKSIQKDVSAIRERLVKVEQSAESAHTRIDELMK